MNGRAEPSCPAALSRIHKMAAPEICKPYRTGKEIRGHDSMDIEIVYTLQSSDTYSNEEDENPNDGGDLLSTPPEEDQESTGEAHYFDPYDFFTWMLRRVQKSATFSFFQTAVKTGALEFTFKGHDRGGHPVIIVRAVGFLIWAERHGYAIPDDLEPFLEGTTANRPRKSEIPERQIAEGRDVPSNGNIYQKDLTSFAHALVEDLYRQFEPVISELMGQRNPPHKLQSASALAHQPIVNGASESISDDEKWMDNKEAAAYFCKEVGYLGKFKSAKALISKACHGKIRPRIRTKRVENKIKVSFDSLNTFISHWKNRDMDREDEETRRQRGD